MNWKYIKPLINEESISEYQNLVNYTFPKDFIDTIKLYNGGRPENKYFTTSINKERVLKSFLSFNHNDIETVWKVFDNLDDIIKTKYVPFAMDNFGNLICFAKNNQNIIFLDYETLQEENICRSFNTFLNILY